MLFCVSHDFLLEALNELCYTYNKERNMSKLFKPLNKEQEREILTRDDERFSATTAYIENLILTALSRFTADEGEKTIALKNLKLVIPIAAQRYLGESKNKEYKFSTYFTWYIHEEIEKYNWKGVDEK